MIKKLQTNATGTFTKQDSVSFDPSLWASTNGTIDWTGLPEQQYFESDVFHTELTHTAGENSDIGWTIRIGKGGQIYYINLEGMGQLICPQRVHSAWNDDCMTTTVYSSADVNNDDEMKVGSYNDHWTDGYIHGSGMYSKPHMDLTCVKPFYNPILFENFDASDRSYSIINWGLVPKPSINRGDVLFYSRYRDMGNGVLEITFYCYNFGPRIYNFAETPWFAVRPSKFPNMVEGINGTSSFKVNNKTFKSGAISPKGGWGAHTVNPTNPNSITCALVWGSKSTGMGVNFGVVNTAERDMSLIAPSKSVFSMPYGKGIRYRRYVVFGNLKDVADLCSKLDEHAFFETIEFASDDYNKIPVYETTINGYKVLTDEVNGSIVGYTYSIPVKDSLPLFLMKETSTNEYFISTDPYAVCGVVPFINPYPIDHPKYSTYQNRKIYQIYDGKTEWIKLLGYVSPIDGAIPSNFSKISDILPDINFKAGEKLNSSELIMFSV